MNIFGYQVGKTPQQYTDENPNDKAPDVKAMEMGSAGTEIYGGYLFEEYLQALRSDHGAEVFDRMDRSDAIIGMIIKATRDPIKSADWSLRIIEPIEELDEAQREIYDKEAKKQMKLVSHILFDGGIGKTFTKFMGEILLCLKYGYSLFERTHKIHMAHPEFGTYVGYKNIGWRSPKTIERWNVDRSGELISVEQISNGDTGRIVTMLSKFLLHFAPEQEGDNFEGLSILRRPYGAWLRKDFFQKIKAVGAEKYGIPTPVMEVPEGKENSQQYKNAKKILEAYVGGKAKFIMTPAGWKLEFNNIKFDAEKFQFLIDAENKEMALGALVAFLLLGTGGGSGSYALSDTLFSFFILSEQAVADHIEEQLNNVIIEEIITLNYTNGKRLIEIKCADLKEAATETLSKILKNFTDSGIVKPDDELEKWIRNKYNLPPVDAKTSREDDTSKPTSVQLAEKKNLKRVNKNTDKIHKFMAKEDEVIAGIIQTGIENYSQKKLKELRKKLDKATGTSRYSVVSKMDFNIPGEYFRELFEQVLQVSANSITMLEKETNEKVQLAETSKGRVSPRMKARIKNRVLSLVRSHVATVQKAIDLQFMSSIDSTDSTDQIIKDIKEKLNSQALNKKVSKGGAAIIVNQTFNDTWSLDAKEDDKFLDEVESYTFINGDPQTTICTELNGRTFLPDDPDLDKYRPPLHPNCKSYLVPNLKKFKDNPEIDRDRLVLTKAAQKEITL